MIARNVGEGRDVEAHVGNAVERQCVRAHLHCHRRRAQRAHRSQEPVQLGRKRRRVFELPMLRPELRPDRADDSARHAGLTTDRSDHPRSRRLTVGSGDADNVEPLRGIAVKRRRQRRKRQPRIGHADHRDRFVGHGECGLVCLLDDDGGGSARYGIGEIAMAVGLRSAQRHEERTGMNGARSGHDIRNTPLRIASDVRRRQRLQ